tara:strand:- start:75 stop:749 length:675 start_codon:yes stop_codon:yes gene_type:complete
MQITKQTIDILKNFSDINSSILVQPGSELQTIAAMKNILAKSEVTEDFSTKFAIYDLPEFLNLVTSPTFEGAEVIFSEDSVLLQNGRAQSTYFYADESTIITPQKTLDMPEPEISFELSKEDLITVKNVAGILQKADLIVSSDGETISLGVLDKKDSSSNDFKMTVGEGNGVEYIMYFKIENIKVIRGNYTVKISSKGISHFTNNDIPVEYWIALEPDSTYGSR